MEAVQLSLFDDIENNVIKVEELFEAYYDCRKNKRRTIRNKR